MNVDDTCIDLCIYRLHLSLSIIQYCKACFCKSDGQSLPLHVYCAHILPFSCRMPLSLLLFGALIVRGFSHVFLCKTPRDYASNRAPWAFNYGTGYPPLLLIFIIVLEYSSISPIILLFGTIYFCIAYVVYKYQLLYGKCGV